MLLDSITLMSFGPCCTVYTLAPHQLSLPLPDQWQLEAVLLLLPRWQAGRACPFPAPQRSRRARVGASMVVPRARAWPPVARRALGAGPALRRAVR
jgi:hypothetical protein